MIVLLNHVRRWRKFKQYLPLLVKKHSWEKASFLSLETQSESTAFFLNLSALAAQKKRSWVEWNCVPYGWGLRWGVLVIHIVHHSSPRERLGEGSNILLPRPLREREWYSTFPKLLSLSVGLAKPNYVFLIYISLFNQTLSPSPSSIGEGNCRAC